MSDIELSTEENAELALRALQKYDELIPSTAGWRYLIIEAETALGEILGLECTGEPDGWNADGSVAMYSHDGETCPVHEWLNTEDKGEAEAMRRRPL